jgi:polyhydroxyalkanoate synthase
VKQDTFIVGAVEDHITPWRSAFRTTSLLGGKVEFVLSSSGHIAGVVNPPSKSAAFWLHEQLEENPDAWHIASTRHGDTWWNAWAKWMKARSGDQVPAPAALGSDEFPPLADAPGLYILER